MSQMMSRVDSLGLSFVDLYILNVNILLRSMSFKLLVSLNIQRISGLSGVLLV